MSWWVDAAGQMRRQVPFLQIVQIWFFIKKGHRQVKHTTILNRGLWLLRTTCASKHTGERDLSWTDHLQGNRATKARTRKRSLGLPYRGQAHTITVSWKGRKGRKGYVIQHVFSQVHLDIPQQTTGAGSIPQMLSASSPRAQSSHEGVSMGCQGETGI